MKKNLRYLLLAVVLLLLAFWGFGVYNRSLSPAALAEHHQDGLDITVQYGQPTKKGRYIFGREKDQALVPYGKVWRTGANEATVITFKQDVLFAGKLVKQGKYSLWTIPDAGSWKVILNTQTGQWGTEYNDGQNLFQSTIPIRVRKRVQQLLSIYFEPKSSGVDMILSWDQTEAIIPIQPR